MARAIWSGAISFGLVNVPVKLYSAVSNKEIHFHMLHAKDGARIQMKRFCTAEEKEVPWSEIIKGYEVSKRKIVQVTPDELQGLDPRGSRTIDIEDFVGLDEIDPIYYESTYYLVPDGAAKPYALLVEAMEKMNKVGIARFVMRTKQHLCAVRPMKGTLALSTMQYADEIVPVSDVAEVKSAKPAPRELEMARQLIDSLSTTFKPEKYKDDYRERVLELIEKKAKGQDIELPAAEPEDAEVVSLMDALKKSIERGRVSRPTTTTKRGGAARAKRVAAKKAPARSRKTAPRATAAKRSRSRKKR